MGWDTLESRTTPGASTLAHHDAVLGCLRGAGFSIRLTAQAYALIDSYVFGFVHTELTLPFHDGAAADALAVAMLDRLPPGGFPHLAEFAREHVLKPGYAYGNEFPFGLELVLDGLQRALDAERVTRGPD